MDYTANSSRRKMRSSKSGGGSMSRQHQHADPVLALMMGELAQRQSWSNSGVKAAESHTAAPPGHRGRCSSLWQQLWFRLLVAVLVLAGVALAIALPVAYSRQQQASAAAARQRQPPQHGLGPRLNTSHMALVFAEDFTSFDSAVWNIEVGDGADYGLNSWGNNELQCYTNSPNNLDVIPHPDYPEDDGLLRIRPVFSATPVPCANLRAPNSTRQWTSAKIDTKNKIAFTWSGQQVYRGPWSGRRAWSAAAAATPQPAAPQPGARKRLLAEPADISNSTSSSRNATATASSLNTTSSSQSGYVVVESRIKLPVAAGRWSAVWMLPWPMPCPAGSTYSECGAFGGWPKSGEIDIVEHVNTDAEVLGTVHFALTGHQHRGGQLSLSPAALLDWNIFQLVWSSDSITWYVNTVPIHQITKAQVGAAQWPFDEPFFLILNTAVGGWLTGNVAPDLGESRPFLVDYVRVYAAAGQQAAVAV